MEENTRRRILWKKFRASCLISMLFYYGRWKNPYYLFNSNKETQYAKEKYIECKKRMYGILKKLSTIE